MINMENFLSAKVCFCYFQTTINSDSGFATASSLYGWKSLEEIFPIPLCVRIFNILSNKYAYQSSEVGLSKNPILILVWVK